jgi:Na+-translocating ferredoxin:NAD+ oxidoreductase RnfD subunit
MVKLASIKTQLIIFLVSLAIFLSFQAKEGLFLLTTSIAVLFAIAVDAFLSYLKNKKFTLTESSIVSGLIIGFILYSQQPWWIFALASLFAICSKHLVRFKNKHIFNPAAFGVFLVIILLRAETQWKGTYLWYIIVPAGLYFSYKIRKIQILVGYAVTALSLFAFQAIMQKAPLLNIFGYLSYFYVLIMVIEPKTTPIKPLGKYIFGAVIAALIFVLTELGVRVDAELASLLVVNLFTPLLNQIPERSKTREK